MSALSGITSCVEGSGPASIHAVRHEWGDHKEDSSFGSLLLDAKNAFLELVSALMLTNVRDRLPCLARFARNCYSDVSGMCVRGKNGEGEWLTAIEGVLQGDPAAMVLYGVALLPLINKLEEKYPNVLHTWYADDGAATGDLHELRNLLSDVKAWGPRYACQLTKMKYVC